jgi:hypothetical protein
VRPRSSPLPCAPVRGPVDEAALSRAADLQREVDALAGLAGLARPSDAWAEAWSLEGSAGYCPRSRALHSIASAHAAVARLRECAAGSPGSETLAYRLARAASEIAEARALVAALVADGMAAA